MADEHHHDPTFYRSPRRGGGPPEKLAYVATFSRRRTSPTGSRVDTDPGSAGYGTVVGYTELPNLGDELHHFGWNACSSALCPTGSHTHGDRRYLVVPGLRSSRIYILDTLENPAAPTVVKVLGPEELGKRANYSRPHTVHCGPGYLYVSCLGGGNGAEGPGGVALLDHANFDVLGQFEEDRGLLHQLAVRRLGRAVLPRRCRRVDDQGGCRRGWRDQLRRALLP